MANNQSLQEMLNHPRRQWFVFAACAGFALLFGLPEVDKYNELTSREAEVRNGLEQGADAGKSLLAYRKQLQTKEQQLGTLRGKTMSLQTAQELRDQVVTLARDTGCTMRRAKTADAPSKRDWYEIDAPLDNRVRGEKEKKTPFKLQSQQLTVQVTGPLENVLSLLEKLTEVDKFWETVNLNLRRSTEDQNLIELDMEMLLFDLVKAGTES